MESSETGSALGVKYLKLFCAIASKWNQCSVSLFKHYN